MQQDGYKFKMREFKVRVKEMCNRA